MTERYDERAATHYAAYRPPLHAIILGHALRTADRFSTGLDVGCGTGYSALALARRCDRVYGVDSSVPMLSKASPHPAVRYLCGVADHLPIATGSIQIATFGGSLFYADSDGTRAEVRRVCRGGIVIAYDFEVRLDVFLQQLELDPQALRSEYDHRANFSSTPGFDELAVGSERINLDVTVTELAHVLLSDSNRLDQLGRRYAAADPFASLVGDLRSGTDRPAIEADIYYSKYQIDRSQLE